MSYLIGALQLPNDLKSNRFEELYRTPQQQKAFNVPKLLKLVRNFFTVEAVTVIDLSLLQKPPQSPSFRNTVLTYCSAAAGKRTNAVYVGFDPNALGIPLALSFIFEKVQLITQ